MTDIIPPNSSSGKHISPDLFTDQPSLIGSRCSNCGEIYFPIRSSCSQCSSENLERKNLGKQGVLWSWTIQHYMPKPPYNSGETKDTFTPYGIGLVEMPSGVKVKARLNVNQSKALNIGDTYVLALKPFRTDENGNPILTFVFEREISS
ncbi:Zn-ribbon domain-containing OB-fold protein [Litorimonas haliclonae]|uniref:Zn-ribbon domain-containing OB-fold protein n=1 Tax=Litorimonas haliclonae TaxID=2081977 RepID=UPI0039EEDB3A